MLISAVSEDTFMLTFAVSGDMFMPTLAVSAASLYVQLM